MGHAVIGLTAVVIAGSGNNRGQVVELNGRKQSGCLNVMPWHRLPTTWHVRESMPRGSYPFNDLASDATFATFHWLGGHH